MGKMRVHELAKELGKENKDILEALEGLGVQVSSHMSTVDEEVCEKIKKKFEKKDGAKEEGKPKKKNIIQVFRPQEQQDRHGSAGTAAGNGKTRRSQTPGRSQGSRKGRGALPATVPQGNRKVL